MDQTLQKFECYAWEITKMRSGSDAGTSSPVSPSFTKILVSWHLVHFLAYSCFLVPKRWHVLASLAVDDVAYLGFAWRQIFK